MANTSLRPDTSVKQGSGGTANLVDGRAAIAQSAANSARHRGQGGAEARANDSRRSKPEDDSSDESSSGSGSECGSDSEEETIISDEIPEDKLGLQFNESLKSGISACDEPQLSSQDDNCPVTAVQPAILGEIRKMIQAEFGALKAIVGSERSMTDPRQSQTEVSEPIPSVRAGLHIDTERRLSSAACSPIENHFRLSLDSLEARRERPVSPAVGPTSPDRQVLVRFAEEEKWAATVRAEKPPGATKTGTQLSPIDEKWGKLFDDRGQATKKLEQVLKGLANYIIDEFMPQKSIVIPPDKMAALYSHHMVENEAHPFTEIFKCRTKGWSVGLEDIYQDLGCEYYLIPKDVQSRPSVPSLTPLGFSKWMTSNILAYPDAEAKRLNHIVSELPIDADGPWDGITQRLPKQFSRHILPDKPDQKTRRVLDDVLDDFAEEFLPTSPRQTPRGQQLPRIEIASEKGPSASSAANASPRTTKYMPEPRSRANSTSSAQPSPALLGRAYTDDPSRLSLIHARKRGSEPALPPPPTPLTRSSSGHRRRSSPAMDPYRQSVGEIARANSPVAGGAEEEREGDYLGYVPSRADYTPKNMAGERATPRRVAVVQDRAGNPGPTWDEYLSGRQTMPASRSVFGRGHKASV